MATKKENTVSQDNAIDPFDTVEDTNASAIPKTRRRPVSQKVLKMRALLDASVAAGAPKKMTITAEQVSDFSSAMRRAAKLEGHPELEVSYAFDPITNAFIFGPKSVMRKGK